MKLIVERMLYVLLRILCNETGIENENGILSIRSQLDSR